MPGNKYCFEHDNLDTDGDGECGTYANAYPDMKYRMAPCRFKRTLWESFLHWIGWGA